MTIPILTEKLFPLTQATELLPELRKKKWPPCELPVPLDDQTLSGRPDRPHRVAARLRRWSTSDERLAGNGTSTGAVIMPTAPPSSSQVECFEFVHDATALPGNLLPALARLLL